LQLTLWNPELVDILGKDRTVIIDVLDGGDDEGVSFEAAGVQDGNVQEVALRQGQATKDNQITGVLLDLELFEKLEIRAFL